MKKIKIKNGQLVHLLNVFVKASEADFESTKQAMDHIDHTETIEKAQKKVDKLRDNLVKKYKLDKQPVNQEDNEKASKEYTDILMEDVELEVEIPKAVVDQLRIKPVEITTLVTSGLYTK